MAVRLDEVPGLIPSSLSPYTPIDNMCHIQPRRVYPEVDREYGRISEGDWHNLMRVVVDEGRRVLKPGGSMVVIIQPN
jgi:hypothetical protein